MLIKLSKEQYYSVFSKSTNPFISEKFIELNKDKVNEIVYLMEDNSKPSIGIVLGIKDNELISPFSAPFGGFHFSHENIYASTIDNFILDLKSFYFDNKFSAIKVVFPPSIYGSKFNSKIINSLFRKNFCIDALELTNYINLNDFDNNFSIKTSREYYRQAKRNGLSFEIISDLEEKKKIVTLVKDNRERNNRLLRMTIEDFVKIQNIWHVEYVGVYDSERNMVAGGIFYHFPDLKIIYAAIWGDSILGRPLRAMDFLAFECWVYFKSLGMKFIDLGISTENKGEPNEGLLRFKETHDANTELRYVINHKK